MTLHGADTEALDALGSSVEDAARRLDAIAARLGPRVLSAPWEGTDADGFRDRWLGQSRGLLERGSERLAATGRELRDQVEQQDRASSTATGAGTAGAPGAPASTAAQRDAEDLVDPADPTSTASSTDLGLGPVTLSGGQDGEGGTESSASVTGTAEAEAGAGPVTASLSTESTVEIGHDVADDGSRTYTLEGTLQTGGELGVDGARWGAAYGFEDGSTYRYAVALPAGATVDPLSVDPADPGTLPPGASVTVDLDQFHGDSFSAEYRALRAELGITGTDGLSTRIEANDDGTVSVDSGPTSSLESAVRLGVGTDEVSAGIANTWTHGTERFEHADFRTSTPEGLAAYRNAMANGVYPDGEGPGVSDRYTTTHTTSENEQGVYLDVDAGPVSLAHDSMSNAFSDRLVVRDYPDGSQNFEQVIHTHGTETGEYTSVVGGTDRDTTYSMHVTPSGNQEVSAYSTYYPDLDLQDGQPLRLEFTQDEVRELAANHAQNSPGVSDTSSETYVTRMLAASNNMGPDWMLQDLHTDHAGYRDPETGAWHASGNDGMPGRIVRP
jgi:hypothetical protein